MGRFLDDLDLRLQRDDGARPVFVLLATFRYLSESGTMYVVPAGAVTDGPSIPQLAMSITGYPGMRAAVVHDWLVRHPEIVAREEADRIFAEALDACGVGAATAHLMYQAVAGYTQQLREQAAATPFGAEGGA